MVRLLVNKKNMIDSSGGCFPQGENNIFSLVVLKKNTQTNHDDIQQNRFL
jgi:hypothetical protein